jgi:hypothetical protein
MIPSGLVIDLASTPQMDSVPFGILLADLMARRFEKTACRTHLEDRRRRWSGLRPEGVADGGHVLEEGVLFPRSGTWFLFADDSNVSERPPGGRHRSRPIAMQPTQTEIPDLAQGLRRCAGRSGTTHCDERAWLRPNGRRAGRLRWSDADLPGIHRREHASVLIRSRTTSLLVDPIGLQARLPNIGDAPLAHLDERLDAILITHGHADHWHLPSLLASARSADTPVIVPRVPRISLLTTHHFDATLKACGQNVLAPTWGETVRIGDIEIDVLPLYGEQPSRTGMRPLDGLRSWGNCYRINTEQFSCILLVDGGDDPEGRMEDVLAASRRHRGPADVVLACQREFLSPFFGGLEHYWAALPWNELARLYGELEAGKLPSTTAGTFGIADACVAVGARAFLPYANGFAGVGRAVKDVGWGAGEPSEAARSAALRMRLSELQATVDVLAWNSGDVAQPSSRNTWSIRTQHHNRFA